VVSASRNRDSTPSVRWYFGIKFFLPAVVFCWPVLYLFNHVFPVNGRYTALGNDFIALYYKYKIYLLAHLADFSFPLWSPAESAGYPFYSSPFTQAFYPFNLLLAGWYKIFGGYNPLDHQVFTVLGVSIFALGLFMWLRLVNSSLRAVVFAVLVMSVSFKVTEILRFPNAVHTAAWYPWILYAITQIFFSRSLKTAVFAGIGLTFFMVCFFTGGYPYYVYYGLFLFAPYVLVFILRPLRLRFFGNRQIHWKRAFATLTAAAGTALLLCSPYFLAIWRLMAETTRRAGGDFAHSTDQVFDLEDTLGSLVYPPAAQTEGWYFFSVTGLLVIFLYMFSSRKAARNAEQMPSTWPSPCDLWIKLFFVLWLGVITYISYGHHSYLFVLLWKFMPGFSSLRIWPRLNIILVPIFAWLLSLAWVYFESVILRRDAGIAAGGRQRFLLVLVLAGVYAAVLGTQLYFYLNKIYDVYWIEFFQNVSSCDINFIIYGLAAFVAVTVIVLLCGAIRFGSSRSSTAVLIVLVLVAAAEMRPVGSRMWVRPGGRTNPGRFHLDPAKLNEASFGFCRTDYDNTISLGPNFSVGVIDAWYFSRYVRFLKETEGQLEARRMLLGVKDGTKVFFSESIEQPTVESFLADALRYRRPGHLLSYTGDELLWEIQVPVAGYLSFIDNWDRYWKVFVDENEVEMELLFGTFKSVHLAPGRHRVRFSYQPCLF
jgi:hypothetical protein